MENVMGKVKEELIEAYLEGRKISAEMYCGEMLSMFVSFIISDITDYNDALEITAEGINIDLGEFTDVVYDEGEECYVLKEGDLSIDLYIS